MQQVIDTLRYHQFQKDLNRHNQFRLKVIGSCMWPFLKDQQIVIIKKVNFQDIGVGDIVLTYIGKRFFCHRVFKKKKDILQTKADGLTGLDPEVSFNEVLGKVVAVEKKGRTIPLNPKIGFWIAWFTLFSSRIYPFLRKIKKIILFKTRALRKSQKKIDQLIINILSERELSPEGFAVNAEQFIKTVYKEGLSGALYAKYLRAEDRAIWPEGITQKLEQEYMTNLGRNMFIKGQVQEVCQTLDSQMIPSIILRGAVFSDELYSDLGVRPLIDMDFVINKEDFTKTLKVLKGLGFEHHKNYPFFLYKEDLYIDLHLESINFWRIKSWPSTFNIKKPAVWKYTTSYKDYAYIRKLSYEDTILSCCEHLVRHSFDRLIWFIDIALLIKDKPKDFEWDQFILRAKKFNVHRSVYFVFSYLVEYQLAEIPVIVINSLGSFRMSFLEKRNLKRLLANQRSHLSGELLSLMAVDTWKRRFAILWEGAFISQDRFPLVREKLTAFAYAKRIIKLGIYILRKLVSIINPFRF